MRHFMDMFIASITLIGVVGTSSATAQSDWWSQDWTQRTVLTIDHDGVSGTLADYPLVASGLDLGGTSPDSVRVVHQPTGTVVDHGLRSAAGGLFDLSFKVELDSRTSMTDYAVYFDNPDAASTAIDWDQARNNLYDDFNNGTTIDPRWTIKKNTWTQSGGTLRPSGGSSNKNSIVATLDTPLDQSRMPIYFETRVVSRHRGSGEDQRHAYLGDYESTDPDLSTLVAYLRTYPDQWDVFNSIKGYGFPNSETLIQDHQIAWNQWVTSHTTLNPDGTANAWARNEATGLTNAITYNNVHVNANIEDMWFWDLGGSPTGAEWDYVIVRYQAENDPTVTFDEVESQAIPAPIAAIAGVAMLFLTQIRRRSHHPKRKVS